MPAPGFQSRLYRSALPCFGWRRHKLCNHCRRGRLRSIRLEGAPNRMRVPSRPLRIGTRGSPMALRQTALVRERLVAAHPELAANGAVEIVTIRTTGDRVQDRLLAEIGGKGLFVKEIEEAMIAGKIDLAVDSLKDLETWLPDGLVIACVPPRDDPRHAFLSARLSRLACR